MERCLGKRRIGRFVDAFEDQVIQQRVRPERRAEAEFNAGKPRGELGAGGGEVTVKVDARREEIGQHHDAIGPEFDAVRAALGDVRLGQFQERRLDDPIPIETGRDPPSQREEVRVRLRAAAAVRDQQDTGFCFTQAKIPWTG